MTDTGPRILQEPIWPIITFTVPFLLLLPGLYLLVRHGSRLPRGWGDSSPLTAPRFVDAGLVLLVALAFRVPGLETLGLHHLEPFYRMEVGLDRLYDLKELLLNQWAGYHMPLYRLLLALWVRITGDGSVLFARWISVSFGALAAVWVLRWAHEAGLSRVMAVAAGLLVAATPLAIELSRHTSPYAMAAFTAAGLIRAHLAYTNHPSRGTLLRALFWAVAAAGTNLFCWWYVVAAALVVYLSRGLNTGARRAYAGTALVALGLFVWIIPFTTRTMVGMGELQTLLKLFADTEAHRWDSVVLPLQLAGELALGSMLPPVLLTAAGMALGGLAVWAVATWWRGGRGGEPSSGPQSSTMLAALALTGLLIQLGANSLWFYYKDYGYFYPARHFSVAAPAMAVFLLALPRARVGKGLSLAAVGALLVQAFIGSLTPSGRPDTLEPARLLSKALAHRDLVAVAPPFFHSQILLEQLVDRPRRDEPNPLVPDPGRTLGTSLSLVRRGAGGVAGVGVSNAGLSLEESVKGCFPNRLWLLRMDELLPNGEPELNAPLARRVVAAIHGSHGPPEEQHRGHGFTLERFKARPWLLKERQGALDIPLATHGHLVLMDGQPPPRWFSGDRMLTSGSLLCVPLRAGTYYQVILEGKSRGKARWGLSLTPLSPVGRESVLCPTKTVEGKTTATCPPMMARDERPAFRIINGTSSISWATMKLRWEFNYPGKPEMKRMPPH